MITFLEWESDFFGFQIGELVYEEETPEIEVILHDARKNHYKLIYLKSANRVNKITHYLSPIISVYLSCKLTFVYNIDTIELNQVDKNIIKFTGRNDELYDLAFQAGHESRYKLDRQFSNSDFEKMYRKWIDNSRNGIMGHEIYVYEEGNVIQGFITYKKIPPGKLSIGLIATGYDFRGKGIGKALISKTKEYMKFNDINELFVSTQESNKGACEFYLKQGFKIHSKQYIYNIWI